MSNFSRGQSLDNYFRDIGEVQLLSPEEEIDLAKRIKQNDHKALQILVSANLRFVVSVAKSYQNKGFSLEDLINEGNLGLMKAAYRFDETRGFKFISYAVWWIRQSILQAIAEKTRMIRLPLNRISTLTQIEKVYSKLEQEFERSPTNEELAGVLEIESDDIDAVDAVRSKQFQLLAERCQPSRSLVGCKELPWVRLEGHDTGRHAQRSSGIAEAT